MTMLLEPPVRNWACPSCQLEDVSSAPGTRMHHCAGLSGLTAPMVEVPKLGIKPDARHRVLEREDYCPDEDRIMSVVTDHGDGRNDCTVFPMTARWEANSHAPLHHATTVGGHICVTPGTAGVGVANFRPHQFFDPILESAAYIARLGGFRMAWSASAVFAYAVLELASKAGQNLSSDTYSVALYASGTPDKTVTTAALTEYNGTSSQWVTANEVSSSGYSAGGTSVTPISLTQSTNVVKFTSSGSPQWTGVTFTTYGGLVYDTQSGQSNVGLCYNYFGGSQAVTAATFSISWNASGIATFTS